MSQDPPAVGDRVTILYIMGEDGTPYWSDGPSGRVVDVEPNEKSYGPPVTALTLETDDGETVRKAMAGGTDYRMGA